jgi:hypothetical protein
MDESISQADTVVVLSHRLRLIPLLLGLYHYIAY